MYVDNFYITNCCTINSVHLCRLLSLGLLFSLWMLVVSYTFMVHRMLCDYIQAQTGITIPLNCTNWEWLNWKPNISTAIYIYTVICMEHTYKYYMYVYIGTYISMHTYKAEVWACLNAWKHVQEVDCHDLWMEVEANHVWDKHWNLDFSLIKYRSGLKWSEEWCLSWKRMRHKPGSVNHCLWKVGVGLGRWQLQTCSVCVSPEWLKCHTAWIVEQLPNWHSQLTQP